MLFVREQHQTSVADIRVLRRLTGKDVILVGMPTWGRRSGFMSPVLTPLADIADILNVEFPPIWMEPEKGRSCLSMLADGLIEIVESLGDGRRVVFIGESIGALVVMAAAAQLRTAHTLLLDPPLDLSKQWWLEKELPLRFQGSEVLAGRVSALAADVFHGETARQNERLFFDSLAKLSGRCTILVGDTPLTPTQAEISSGPSALEQNDLAAIRERHPEGITLLGLRQTGHLILNQRPKEFIKLARDFLMRLGQRMHE